MGKKSDIFEDHPVPSILKGKVLGWRLGLFSHVAVGDSYIPVPRIGPPKEKSSWEGRASLRIPEVYKGERLSKGDR